MNSREIIFYNKGKKRTYQQIGDMSTLDDGIYSFVEVGKKEIEIRKGYCITAIMTISVNVSIDEVSQMPYFKFKIVYLRSELLNFKPRLISITSSHQLLCDNYKY